MKRLVLSILIVASVPMISAAQDQGWASKFFGPTNLSHNFGNVAWGSLLAHKFTITNIYDVEFMVADARVSCGCVAPKRPQGSIAPKGTADLEITMDTRRIRPGENKVVNIYVTMVSVPKKSTDKVYSSTATLSVRCVPHANIACNPDRVSFGMVALGQTPTGSMTISHKTNARWTLSVAKSDLPFDVAIQRAAPVRGFAAIYQVNVTLKKEVPAGEFKHELHLHTSDPTTPVLPITVEGVVQAPLTATPNNISFGNVRVNEVATRRVIVRGNGQPFRVTAVEGAGDGVQVKFAAEAKGSQILTIEYHPKLAGTLRKTLTIKTDLGDQVTATVAVDGAAMP